ncbi:MAG TPA: thiamine phosphate synthase [Terriglobia bacterium]|nr:thiamine phosphate synthase [Terriglobia bacterium]
MRAPFGLCYITDRKAPGDPSLLALLDEAIGCGIDLIQVRQKFMETRSLMQLAGRAIDHARGASSRIVINDRLDVALALGAPGVHLGSQSLPAPAARALAPPGFLVGVSCHSLEEAEEAESAGADYLLLGPVFETPSKRVYGPPLGLGALRQVTSRVKTPTLALGGMTLERVKPCLDAGATGIAAIRLFEDAPSLAARVVELRAQFG